MIGCIIKTIRTTSHNEFSPYWKNGQNYLRINITHNSDVLLL